MQTDMIYAEGMRKNLSVFFMAFGLLWFSACIMEEPEPEFADESMPGFADESMPGFADESALASESEADGEFETEALPGPCDISRHCSTGNIVSCHGEGYCRVGGSGPTAYVECDGERTLCLIITPE